jgi:hypothetical protein
VREHDNRAVEAVQALADGPGVVEHAGGPAVVGDAGEVDGADRPAVRDEVGLQLLPAP